MSPGETGSQQPPQENNPASAGTSGAAEKPPRKVTMPSRAEWALALVGIVVIVGWVIAWTKTEFSLFADLFSTLSFFGALIVVAYIVVKPFQVLRLPPKIERWLLPTVSLAPVAGYLVSLMTPLYELLTVGGSIALAYFSAITYWRKQFLEIASKQLEGTDPARADAKEREMA